ncbi:hypothetical protein MSPP1_000356 [Malassezia sp. CBS 17886]|nr:hypothetical protein MSPP1_000356 [Malassezia sp. CBS 17886]
MSPSFFHQLYSVISDVDAYSKFIPYCMASRVLGPSAADAQAHNGVATVDAELTIGFSAIRESYVSEVSMKPGQWVSASAKPSALFQDLRTGWTFTQLSPTPSGAPQTHVVFTLQYAFSSPLYAALARNAFATLSTQMVDAFRQRADALYRRRGGHVRN